MEYEFTANHTAYIVAEAPEGWVWEVPVYGRRFAIERDSGRYFATACEAQQDALRDALVEEERSEQDEDAYHREMNQEFRQSLVEAE